MLPSIICFNSIHLQIIIIAIIILGVNNSNNLIIVINLAALLHYTKSIKGF